MIILNIGQFLRTMGCILLLLTWVVNTGCSSSQKRPLRSIANADAGQSERNGAVEQSQSESQSSTPEAEKPETEMLKVSLGLRNFDQINATMAVLTGIPTANPAVAKEYQSRLKALLPAGRTIDQFRGAVQVSIFKLAVEYCDAMMQSEAVTPKILTNFNLKAPPSVALGPEGKKNLVSGITGNFWLIQSESSREGEKKLSNLIDELMMGRTLSTANQTMAIAKAVCSAALASSHVTFY